jgi:hypothetical protein
VCDALSWTTLALHCVQDAARWFSVSIVVPVEVSFPHFRTLGVALLLVIAASLSVTKWGPRWTGAHAWHPALWEQLGGSVEHYQVP